MKKAVWVVAVIGVLFVGSLSVEAETYTFGTLPVKIGWAEYQIADVMGFWEKQGIDIELIEYMPIDIQNAIANRRFDLTPMPMTVVVSYMDRGADLLYLGSLSKSYRQKYFIIKKDLLNKSLKGLTIGNFMSDPANDFLLSSYLNTVNTNLADIRQVAMDPDELEANFIHNRLQAVLTLNQGNKFYEKADGVIAISTVEFYEPHGLTILREGGKIPIPDEDIKKILRGCVEAIEWMRDPANWEEYKAFLKEYSLPPDSPELSDEEFRTLTQGYQYFEPQTLLKHNQEILRDHFEKYRNFLISHESLGKNVLDAFTYDKVIYNQALIEVLQEYGQ